MRKIANGAQLRKLPLFVAVLGCLYGTPALAQDAAQAKPEEAKSQDADK